MIKLTSNLFKKKLINIRSSPSIFTQNKSFFAKQAPAKKGGKQQKKQQVPAVEQQPAQKLLPYQKLINYFAPLQPGLSPSQTQYINQNFNDLQQEQKQMLDQLADKIVSLNTSMFYNFVYKREGLGTSQAYFVGTAQYEDSQIAQAIKILRKDQ